MAATGTGFGKVILFGEHFVVHGASAIVSGLPNLKTTIEIKEGSWNKDFDPKIVSALSAICTGAGLPAKSYSLNFLKEVPRKQNLGSSAAICVAFARALNECEGLSLSDSKINLLAYEGEKSFHGTPSGIDNSASTFGTFLEFRKTGQGKFEISPIKSKGPLHLLIVNSGPKAKGTGELVAGVKELKEKFKFSGELFSLYGKLFKEAKEALASGNLHKLGFLMDANHSLLCALGVSTPSTEKARFALLDSGALGAKITGAGGGGNVIGLFESEKKAHEAKRKLKSQGWDSFYARLG